VHYHDLINDDYQFVGNTKDIRSTGYLFSGFRDLPKPSCWMYKYQSLLGRRQNSLEFQIFHRVWHELD